MSRGGRTCLAIAVAWAGGFASFPGPGWSRLAAGLAVLLACVWLRSHVRELESGPELSREGREDESDGRLRGAVRVLALALLLGLLARSLGRVVIEVPAALWALPIVGLGLLFGSGDRWRPGGAALAVTLALAAALVGTLFEARAPQPRGMVHSGPIIGVHPRQAVSVRIDGFGPHDLVVDDYVDPPGGQGYDPQGFAEWLELELHAIAEIHYADGPARAREAFAGAEVRVVDALVPPSDRDRYASVLGVEVRSGTIGQGSIVAFVCPGRTLGVGVTAAEPSRACPRKYVVDGSTGLGVSSRFPGYAEIRGRDRARLARWLGWPHGEARRDRRSLALESGVWLIAIVVAGWVLARRRAVGELDPSASAIAGLAALGLAGIAIIGSPASVDATTGGPTLLALLVLALAPRDPSAPSKFEWPIAGLIALLAASPLAGIGDVIALLDATVEPLVLGLGLDWSTGRAAAGALAVVALAAGIGVCAGALFEPRERAIGRTQALSREGAIRFAVALAIALALALRKPADDLALLSVACVLLLASSLRLRRKEADAPRLS